ncbi:MAG TPA: hypothetical protein VH331_02220 [Allosphingosinicella sp.]|nr:hypothetical protein [Allosphingosinicella sp.]
MRCRSASRHAVRLGSCARARTRLPRAFTTLVRGNLVIKRVPPSIEAGAP